MNCDLHSSIPDWIVEHPETTAVFDRLGIEMCCGGKSLEYLCFQRNLNPTLVMRQLEDAIQASSVDDGQVY